MFGGGLHGARDHIAAMSVGPRRALGAARRPPAHRVPHTNLMPATASRSPARRLRYANLMPATVSRVPALRVLATDLMPGRTAASSRAAPSADRNAA